jgi:hypothetical protein
MARPAPLTPRPRGALSLYIRRVPEVGNTPPRIGRIGQDDMQKLLAFDQHRIEQLNLLIMPDLFRLARSM